MRFLKVEVGKKADPNHFSVSVIAMVRYHSMAMTDKEDGINALHMLNWITKNPRTWYALRHYLLCW